MTHEKVSSGDLMQQLDIPQFIMEVLPPAADFIQVESTRSKDFKDIILETRFPLGEIDQGIIKVMQNGLTGRTILEARVGPTLEDGSLHWLAMLEANNLGEEPNSVTLRKRTYASNPNFQGKLSGGPLAIFSSSTQLFRHRSRTDDVAFNQRIVDSEFFTNFFYTELPMLPSEMLPDFLRAIQDQDVESAQRILIG